MVFFFYFLIQKGGKPTVQKGLMRGAVAVAANPFAASIRMDSVLYDIYLHDPIEYVIKNEIWTGNTEFHCPKTNMFSRSSFGQGTLT